MTHLNNHWTYAHGLDDIPDGQVLAHIKPASEQSVYQVLTADPNSEDGRSQFVWVRLPNGDLILGVFPQGETYMATEPDHS